MNEFITDRMVECPRIPESGYFCTPDIFEKLQLMEVQFLNSVPKAVFTELLQYFLQLQGVSFGMAEALECFLHGENFTDEEFEGEYQYGKNGKEMIPVRIQDSFVAYKTISSQQASEALQKLIVSTLCATTSTL